MRSVLVGLIIGALVFTAPAALLVVILAYLLLRRPQNPTPTDNVGEPRSPKFTTSPRDASAKDNVVRFPDPPPERPDEI